MINGAERIAKRVRAAMGDHNNDDLPVAQCVINMRKEIVSLQTECEELRKLVTECVDYLDINDMTSIGHGSVLHRKLRDVMGREV